MHLFISPCLSGLPLTVYSLLYPGTAVSDTASRNPLPVSTALPLDRIREQTLG